MFWFCLLIILVIFDIAASLSRSFEYCDEENAEDCDKDGIYQHISVTSFADFEHREMFDDEQQLSWFRPKVALRATKKTLLKFPNSPRAIYNRFLALDGFCKKSDGGTQSEADEKFSLLGSIQHSLVCWYSSLI